MSLFGDDFRVHLPLIPDMNAPLHELLSDALKADDGAHQADEAIRAQLARDRFSNLTVGQIDDHMLALTRLASDVRHGVGDTRDQIADAIEVARDDFQTVRDES